MSRFLLTWGVVWFLLALVFGLYLAIAGGSPVSVEARGSHSHLGLLALASIIIGGVVYPRLGLARSTRELAETLWCVGFLQPIGLFVKLRSSGLGVSMAAVGSFCLIFSVLIYTLGIFNYQDPLAQIAK